MAVFHDVQHLVLLIIHMEEVITKYVLADRVNGKVT